MPESYSRPRRPAGGRSAGYLATGTYQVVGYFDRNPRGAATEANREYTLGEVIDAVRRKIETPSAGGGSGGVAEDVVILQGRRVVAVLRRGEDGRFSPVPVG